MLWKRSRVVGGTSKPAASNLVISSSSPSFFSSPARLFSFFFSDLEFPVPGNTISSIIETKPPSPSKNTFFAGPSINPRAGIADALREEEDGSSTKFAGGDAPAPAVLFGSKLWRVLPADPAVFPFEFGIKTMDLVLLPPSSSSSSSSGRELGRSLSAREMELSEDYTCVISHGANPRTTRIFDGRIIVDESSGEFDGERPDIAGKPFHVGGALVVMMEEEMMM